MQKHIETIKSKVSPSSIISKHIQLDPMGGGEFRGFCPFHAEKTPSFTVSDIKGFYYCFGCQASGDIISFLMEIESMSYRQVLKKLAIIAGVILPTDKYRDKQ